MANRVIETIKSRVSCRYYTTTKVPLSKVKEVAEAGMMAPSGKNRQICNITVVRTKRLVEKLRQLSIDICKRDCYYGASTILLVSGPKDDEFTSVDGACILENMFVAATSLKLNSCWINQTEMILSDPKGARFKKSLGIDENHRVVGACILGYAADPEQLEVKPRKADFIKYL